MEVDFKITDEGKFWGMKVEAVSVLAKTILKKYVGYEVSKKMIPHNLFDNFQSFVSSSSSVPISYEMVQK